MNRSYISAFLICACFTAQKKKMLRIYEQYFACTSQKNITGKDAAEMLLHYYGIFDMPIKVSVARLSDHYDPKADILYLSAEAFESTSVSVIAIAMHVAAHAVQYREKYFLARLCRFLEIPVLICSYLSVPLFIIGESLDCFTEFPYASHIILISVAMLFSFFLLIILKAPVEHDTNRRAFTVIEDAKILNENEKKGAKIVLKNARRTDICYSYFTQPYMGLSRKFWC